MEMKKQTNKQVNKRRIKNEVWLGYQSPPIELPDKQTGPSELCHTMQFQTFEILIKTFETIIMKK